jgi:eukaryotic-like serine/threonine-protein kinase
MVTEEGAVKVLDFGIAKLVDTSGASESGIREPTGATASGIAGTASYVSPEQAEGKVVDARSDIFSFGAVLYEMVTGRRAFPGDAKTSVLLGILEQEPRPASDVVKGVPPSLDRIVARCLKKDPALRFQTMVSVKAAMEVLSERLRPRSWWQVATALLAAVAAGAALWFTRSSGSVPEVPLAAIPLITSSESAGAPSLSPDGKQLAFIWAGEKAGPLQVYVKQIGASEAPRRLTTDGGWGPRGRRTAASLRSNEGSPANGQTCW